MMMKRMMRFSQFTVLLYLIYLKSSSYVVTKSRLAKTKKLQFLFHCFVIGSNQQ